MNIFAQKRIVLGVSGGIAAYKVVQLARDLALKGALVDVVMTESATRFVAPLTFQALTHRPVYTSLWDMADGTDISHVSLGDQADLILIAPATANTIARLAAGFSDDMLTTTVLASQAPLLVAPAMNVHMWANQATQANVATLRQRGMTIIDPEAGRMAEPMIGVGRLADIRVLEAAVAQALGQHYGPLAGRRVLVTAGGTHEPIDPVRFIGNHSSGLMGFALAEQARDLGAKVTLICGPATAQPPEGVALIKVQTAQAMHDAVHVQIKECDLLIMAAAVADYRPHHAADQKIKKTEAQADQRSIELTQTIDILGSLVEQSHLVKVGFAAETHDLERYARDKMSRKKLDFIVANDARTALGAADNMVTVFAQSGTVWPLERLPKHDVARAIFDILLNHTRLAQPSRIQDITNE